MSIEYVSFIPGVAVSVGTRDITAMNGYAASKHSRDLDVEETPTEVVFHVKDKGKRTGRRIRVMKAAIASIQESGEVTNGKR